MEVCVPTTKAPFFAPAHAALYQLEALNRMKNVISKTLGAKMKVRM